MLTDWKTIAKRVSNNLNIPLEDVESDILKYAKNLQEELRKGSHLEYDYFYLGRIVINSPKLTKYWNNLKVYPDRKNYPIIKKLVSIRDSLKGKKSKEKIRSENNKHHRDKYPQHY